MVFPITVLDVAVDLAFNADLTANPSTWTWTAVPSTGSDHS